MGYRWNFELACRATAGSSAFILQRFNRLLLGPYKKSVYKLSLNQNWQNLSVLGSAEDSTSIIVRRQYEENPYPSPNESPTRTNLLENLAVTLNLDIISDAPRLLDIQKSSDSGLWNRTTLWVLHSAI